MFASDFLSPTHLHMEPTAIVQVLYASLDRYMYIFVHNVRAVHCNVCVNSTVWSYYLSSGSNGPTLETHFIRGNCLSAMRIEWDAPAIEIGHHNYCLFMTSIMQLRYVGL